jgi:hypothetical protein
MTGTELEYRFTDRKPKIISESIMTSAKEGVSEQQEMSDIERAARAIVTRLGHDPDALACNFLTRQVSPGLWLMPNESYVRPLWTFYMAEAEAALSVLDI